MSDRLEELAKAIVGWHDGNDCDKCIRWVHGQLRTVAQEERRKALEEAARVVERLPKQRGWTSARTVGMIGTLAAAIRALLDQPTPGETK